MAQNRKEKLGYKPGQFHVFYPLRTLRRRFVYLCSHSSSITAVFMFVLFAFSWILISPVLTFGCKSKIAIPQLYPGVLIVYI